MPEQSFLKLSPFVHVTINNIDYKKDVTFIRIITKRNAQIFISYLQLLGIKTMKLTEY